MDTTRTADAWRLEARRQAIRKRNKYDPFEQELLLDRLQQSLREVFRRDCVARLAVALAEEEALLDADSLDTSRVDHVSREVDGLFDLFKAIDLYNCFRLLKEMVRDGFLGRRLGLKENDLTQTSDR
jgi:hypothetical protein